MSSLKYDASAENEIDRLKQCISEMEAQNKRLTSRGFEDLHDENERLKAKLERVRKLPERYSGEIYWDCETGNEYCEETYVSKELIKEALADD